MKTATTIATIAAIAVCPADLDDDDVVNFDDLLLVPGGWGPCE